MSSRHPTAAASRASCGRTATRPIARSCCGGRARARLFRYSDPRFATDRAAPPLSPVMSEVLALLQTDVVGSTALSERLGDAATAALWSAHDRVSRDLLRRCRGREIDKSDGFLLLFATAADALEYALGYQSALAGLGVPLTARAGLHVGPVTTRANSAEDIAQGAKPL